MKYEAIKKEIEWYTQEGFGDPFQHEEHTHNPLIINAALTGMVPTHKDTPHIPITSEEIVRNAVEVFEAGAQIVHLHARDNDGAPVWEKENYEKFVLEIKKQCPGIIICLTTSGRLYNVLEKRSDVLLLEGDAKPDMASITLGSLNFPKSASVTDPAMIQALVEKMNERNIKPEREIFEIGMLNYSNYLERKGFFKDAPAYFNILLGSLGSTPARVTDLEYILTLLPDNAVWAATGIGRFQLPINILAILKGGHVRVGLEDSIYYDAERTQLATNKKLVERLVSFAKETGRPLASVEEVRKDLNL